MEMVAGDPPRVQLAAGMADGGFGTDAARVAEAIEAAQDGDGVVVLTDLGSAVLSAQMAVEFLPDPDAPVRIVAAPFVEGLLAALVRAAGGGSLDQVAAEAAGALRPKAEQLGEDSLPDVAWPGEADAPDAVRAVVLVNSLGLHARPAAQFAAAASTLDAEVAVSVPGRKPVPARSPLAVAGLGTRGGDEVTLGASGPGAREAVDALAQLILGGFGEAVVVPEPWGTAIPGAAPSADGAPLDASVAGGESPGAPSAPGGTTRGLGVSPGRVVGLVARMPEPLAAPVAAPALAPGVRDAEAGRIAEAARGVGRELLRRAEAASGEAADILEASAAIVEDEGALDEAARAVRSQGVSAELAVWNAFGAVADGFRSAGGRLAERASDVLDARRRIVAALRGVEPPGVPQRDEPYVLVARDLAPADTAGLSPRTVLAIVASEGGPTSHTAILARSLGIPAVVGLPGAPDLVDGSTVLVDGATGEVLVDPGAEAREGAGTARDALVREVRDERLEGHAVTADGHEVKLLANVGGAADARGAAALGVSGVGLFRTEFAFLDRADAPGEEEQARLYAEVLRSFPGGRVVLRTLDSGSDKPLPFLHPAREENPALGVRGLRTAREHPEILSTQLAAMAAAAREVPGTEAWVMAPMVATAQEAQWFASLAREAGLEHVGVMVETPAAALCSGAVMESLDFVSLGTNDLAQYTMAADRLSVELSELNDPWQPAVLRLIASTVEGAGSKPVGVCGEAASDPLLAAVLVGLGVSSLSGTPRVLPAVRRSVGAATLAVCREAAGVALSARGAREAKAAAREVLGVRAQRE